MTEPRGAIGGGDEGQTEGTSIDLAIQFITEFNANAMIFQGVAGALLLDNVRQDGQMREHGVALKRHQNRLNDLLLRVASLEGRGFWGTDPEDTEAGLAGDVVPPSNESKPQALERINDG